ncbi:MAG: metalloregulator ArsR/SmtB family transcription factor [Boseongicola sp.]|nr:metalloregulator ArsR/SmtB family transcription factor [Boseongicola sp.]
MHAAAPADTTLDALGNPVRREILRMLADGPRSAGDIAQAFPISRPAISKHLRILNDAEIIAHESVGNKNIYRLNPGGFQEARDWLDSFWDNALQRLAVVAENTNPNGSR